MDYLFINSMKAVMACFCLIAFASCTAVYFDTTQPKDGITLALVPTELTGMWIDMYDTITISDHCLRSVSYKTDSLGIITKDDSTLICLSDSVVLKKAGDYYVVNNLGNNGWEITLIERNRSGDLIWYVVHDPPFFGEGDGLRVQRVKKRHPVKNEKEDLPASAYKPLFKDPLDPDLKVPDISSVYYTGQFKKKHIKKFLTAQNIEFIFKADGTIGWKD